MKKNKKLFGKLYIVDVLMVILIIGVIFVNMGRFSSGGITTYSHGEEVTIRYEAITYEYDPIVFERLVAGTVLAQDKKYLDAIITDIELLDIKISQVDNNGDLVTAANPFYKKARITIEATVLYEDEAYKLGNQEVREAKPHFIVTEWNNVSAIVTKLEILE